MPGTTWRKGDMPEDGSVIFVRVVRPYRFKIYKSNSEEFRHGKKGRWQQMNEFGGWDNCEPPTGFEWSIELPDSALPFLSYAESLPKSGR
ncbi:hypothetical protein [Ensifer sp. 1H6]|uniref:hypothetical protein n=1 Tax=Ensifer sp. 1H6 TaxID=1911585 RepID=UPI000FE2608F|nr:hypothetical protein [Ensifer sp. 1H6]